MDGSVSTLKGLHNFEGAVLTLKGLRNALWSPFRVRAVCPNCLTSTISGTRAMDIIGNLRKQPLTISGSPIYLLGEAGKASAALKARMARVVKVR